MTTPLPYLILNQVPDAILVLDSGYDQNLQYCNQAAERLYGWSVAELFEHNAAQIFDTIPLERLREARQALLAQGEWAGELQQVTKAGDRIIVESRWSLIRKPDATPAAILMIHTDVTAKKLVENQFLGNQRLESIGRLAGGIAHDLNNALAPVALALEILRNRAPGTDEHDVLDTVETSLKRGVSLLKQIQSYVNCAHGEKVLVQPRQLLQDLALIVRGAFAKNITLVLEPAENLRPVSGDPTQLQQVLLNLCLNAQDAMPQGGSLTLAAENLRLDESSARMMEAEGIKPGPYVLLLVTDTGIGISEENWPKIFEPFFTTKTTEPGTSLGLITVESIVKNHGGLVRVRSKSGHGTQFKVYLPAVNVPETPAEELPDEPSLAGHDELVLVVDDELCMQGLLQKALVSHGYRVLTADDGTDALALYAQHRDQIRVVLTDLRMPFLDGPATIAALRKMDPQIKVIIASGSRTSADQSQVEALQVEAFLTKPFSTRTLLVTLHDVLHNVQTHGSQPSAECGVRSVE